MREYFRLVKNLDFFLLWVSQVVSQFGDKLNQMALIAWAYSVMPGSSFQMAKLIFFTIVPVFVVGPFAAAAVDRLDFRKTMYICDLIRAITVVTIPLLILPHRLILPVYLMVFISFSITRLFVPAKMSIVPNIVGEKEILPANSLLSLTGVVAAMFGFGLGGILVQSFGIRFGFLVDAATFLISAVSIYLIGRNYKPRQVSIREEAFGIGRVIVNGLKYTFGGGIISDVKKGFEYLGKNREIKRLIGVSFLLWGLLGGIYATGIVFIQESLGSATADLGMLVVFLGIGILLGSLMWGKLGIEMDRFKMLYSSLIALSFFLFVFAVALRFPLPHKFGIAGAIAFILGLSASPIMMLSQTIIHETADEGMMGRMFGIIEIIVHFAFVVAMFISSLLAEFFSEGSILILWAGIGIGIGVDGLLRLRWENA